MKSLVLFSSLLFALNAFAGQDKGNGGFLYSRTSLKLLESSKESLLSDMDNLIKNKNQKVYTSTKCSKPIDLFVLRESIENLTYDFEAENTATNPEGKKEKRYFYINTQNKIEATELYFSSFVDTYFRYIESSDFEQKEKISLPLRTALIHEALHLFDYNELEARECSANLLLFTEGQNTVKRDLIKKNNQLAIHKFLTEECKLREITYSAKMSGGDWNLQRELSAIQLYNLIAVNGKKHSVRAKHQNFRRSELIMSLKEVITSPDKIVEVIDARLNFSFTINIPK